MTAQAIDLSKVETETLLRELCNRYDAALFGALSFSPLPALFEDKPAKGPDLIVWKVWSKGSALMLAQVKEAVIDRHVRAELTAVFGPEPTREAAAS